MPWRQHSNLHQSEQSISRIWTNESAPLCLLSTDPDEGPASASSSRVMFSAAAAVDSALVSWVRASGWVETEADLEIFFPLGLFLCDLWVPDFDLEEEGGTGLDPTTSFWLTG